MIEHRSRDLVNRSKGKRVAVAMSGGVDSSVAAAMLVEQGHEVVGVYMKLADLPAGESRARSCCSLDDTLDARQVCAGLGIPFYVVDYRREFEREVIDYFVNGYQAGATPNPCAVCNSAIKSKLLLRNVREFGCDMLATGHYAKIRRNPDSGDYQLVRPRDRHKDQTYFLFGTAREELPHLLFPLGESEKPAARAMAKKLGFINWDKPDSQEVCFVPGDYRAYLRGRGSGAPPEPGAFVDLSGRELGRHPGLPYFTVGQRRGLGISGPAPYYVLELRPESNEVVLGGEEELYSSTMRVEGLNWLSCPAPSAPLEAVVKVRLAHQGTRARVEPLEDGAAQVTFLEPVRAVSPGQAAVFYTGDVLLGGGWIAAPARPGAEE